MAGIPGESTRICDNGMLAKNLLTSINTESNIFNILAIIFDKMGICIGMLIKNPNIIMMPIIRLTNKLEKINVKDML